MLYFLMTIKHILIICIIHLNFEAQFLKDYNQAYKFHFFHHIFDLHQYYYKFIFHNKKDINIFEFLLNYFLKRFFLSIFLLI